jgi:hypothetical protein
MNDPPINDQCNILVTKPLSCFFFREVFLEKLHEFTSFLNGNGSYGRFFEEIKLNSSPPGGCVCGALLSKLAMS